MTYEYAATKIEKLFNRALECIDKIRSLIEPNSDWLDISLWCQKMETVIADYQGKTQLVIEMYIELTSAREDWRDLHKYAWNFAERLEIEVTANKTELDGVI